jgi:hypothetical protein
MRRPAFELEKFCGVALENLAVDREAPHTTIEVHAVPV